MHLPFAVADYVDFYASEHHARNVGQIFRPGAAQPLAPTWLHQPTAYHGRAGTVIVSGTPVRRPYGQSRPDGVDSPQFGPSARLDFEAELGFVVGVPSMLCEPIAVSRFTEHVFGVCLVNDWSARDIQAWESAPLGPFLGKSFGTTVSAWVLPLAALQHARLRPPSRDTDLLPYLTETADWGLDIDYEVRINGHLVSRPRYADMHWSPAQMLAHLTVNGASAAHRRPVRLRHGQRPGPGPARLPARADLERHRAGHAGRRQDPRLAARQRRGADHRHRPRRGRRPDRPGRGPRAGSPGAGAAVGA